MENYVLTQLSIPEIRQLFRQELEAFHNDQRLKEIRQPEIEKPIDIREASEFTGLAVTTLYGKSQRGEIPSCKQGKRVYFWKRSLADWIKEGQKQTLAESDQRAESYLKSKGKGASCG